MNFVDFDDNGFLDVFVANDKVRNFALLNQGDGTFVDKAAELGLAYDNKGNATATMGSDYAYYIDTKTLALAAGNFSREATSVWVALKPMLFADFSTEEGIGTPTFPYVTFGLFFADAKLGTGGLIALGGVVSMVVGGMILFDTRDADVAGFGSGSLASDRGSGSSCSTSGSGSGSATGSGSDSGAFDDVGA